MTDANDQQQEKTVCLNCGTTSDDRLLIAVKKEDADDWVCARCLPQFIHGPH